jgi:hypothetical protein
MRALCASAEGSRLAVQGGVVDGEAIDQRQDRHLVDLTEVA